MMKAIQSALRLNELLGFVRRHHSAMPDRSMLILSLNAPTAAWRFNAPYQSTLNSRARLTLFKRHDHSRSLPLK
jgi:hypothetical protein